MKTTASALVLSLFFAPGTADATSHLDSSVLSCRSDNGPTFYPRNGRLLILPNSDVAPFPIFYRFQADGAPGVADGSDFDAVNAAFDVYNLHQCDGLADNYPNLYMLDGKKPEVSEASGFDTDYPDHDNGDTYSDSALTAWQNIVRWVSTESTFHGGASTLAVTTNTVLEVTEITVTADIEFNAIDFDWRTDTDGCAASDTTCHDIGTVALHEIGHFIGLGHVDCADAVMFKFNDGKAIERELSVHEQAGLCSIYPPRNAAETARDFGEQCQDSAPCGTGLICVREPGYNADQPWGFCSTTCSVDADCSPGFECDFEESVGNYCAPGAVVSGLGSGGEGDPGFTDPDTGNAVDFCDPCTSGAQCSNGICAGVGDGNNICTQGCASGPGLGCPTGFTCAATDQNFSVCFPDNPASCGGADSRGAINDLCFAPGTLEGGGDFFNPCRPGLACFGFAPICGGQIGACVVYCNATDLPYNGRACPDADQTCCFGVDDAGNCVTSPNQGLTEGGCFDVREAGQSCVVAENSVCRDGARCVAFQSATNAKCFPDCSSTGSCSPGEDCRPFVDGCDNEFALCCDSRDTENCKPVFDTTLYDVGVSCLRNNECRSGLCLQIAGGGSACTEPCNPVTAEECPAANADVNRDGTPDGPFSCRSLDGDYYCWPDNGPVLPGDQSLLEPPGEGCCDNRAARIPASHRALSLLLWGPAGLFWLRSRRRQKKTE